MNINYILLVCGMMLGVAATFYGDYFIMAIGNILVFFVGCWIGKGVVMRIDT